MILKICKIANIGRLVNCCPAGDVQFRRLTLIYAENGRGKTTFADVLRSLRDGSADRILGRRTLGGPDGPSVHIRLDTGNAMFRDGRWDTLCPNIEIYDATFVHDNIHSGDVVDHEHKKSLYKTVIGNKAVKLAETVSLLDGLRRKTLSLMRAIEEKLAPKITGSLPLSDFLALGPVEDIQARTEAKEAEVQALTKAKAIADKPPLATIDLAAPPSGLDTLLGKELPDLTEEVERRVKAQIASLADADAEAWLSQGASYLKHEKCPFCKADTRGNTLVAAYSAYFSAAYRDLKLSISDARDTLAKWCDSQAMLQLQARMASNTALAEFWNDFVAVDLPQLEFSAVREAINDFKHSLDAALAKKQVAPLEKVELDDSSAFAIKGVGTIPNRIAAYNAFVSKVNAAIQAKKMATATGNLVAAKKELLKLHNVPVRTVPETDALCLAYIQHTADIAECDVKKQATRRKLDEEVAEVFGKYSLSINRHLEGFGAGFQIGPLTPSYSGGSPSTTFSLFINDVSIELGDAGTPVGMPCFKNTMSSGDKSALAFAFFLATLDGEESLRDKVVLLDDPMSSQDRFRSNYTQEQICRLGKMAQEVIVLSHDAYFLRRLWDRATDKGAVKTLAVVREGRANSTIAEWDIERETAGEYYQNYDALVAYLEDPVGMSLVNVARCIRPLLEGNLRLRFPGQFRTGWLGTFIEQIRVSYAPELAGIKQWVPELEGINEFSKRYHHDTNPAAGMEGIDDTELKTFVERTMHVLFGVWHGGTI